MKITFLVFIMTENFVNIKSNVLLEWKTESSTCVHSAFLTRKSTFLDSLDPEVQSAKIIFNRPCYPFFLYDKELRNEILLLISSGFIFFLKLGKTLLKCFQCWNTSIGVIIYSVPLFYFSKFSESLGHTSCKEVSSNIKFKTLFSVQIT